MKETTPKKTNPIIVIGVLLFCAFIFFMKYSNKENDSIKVDINNEQQILDAMQGRWSYNVHTGLVNETFQYRFEITGNQLKIWSDIGNVEDKFDMSKGYKTHKFTLSEPTRDVDGHPCRYLQFDESNVSLTYRSIDPIWVIDKPFAMRSGAGIPYWKRDWGN